MNLFDKPQLNLFDLPDPKDFSESKEFEKAMALEKKVFIFPSSEKDKTFFKWELHKYVVQELHCKYSSLQEYLHEIIWKANDEGKTCKYLYFNEKLQKLYVDRQFRDWAICILNIIENKIT